MKSNLTLAKPIFFSICLHFLFAAAVFFKLGQKRESLTPTNSISIQIVAGSTLIPMAKKVVTKTALPKKKSEIILSAGSDSVSVQSNSVQKDKITNWPKVIVEKKAIYPQEARIKKQEADVEVEMLVSETGLPSDLKIIKSPSSVFEQAAMTALKQFKFTPAFADGQAQPVKIRYTYKFRLQSSQL